MGSLDNQKKAQHGQGARRSLEEVVYALIDLGAVVALKTNPGYGYDGYSKKQFKANVEVTFSDQSKCVLYSTSSIRSDRIKGQQWDAANIKSINPRIEFAYLIVPDEASFDQGTSVRDSIRNKEVISAIDDILTVEEFYNIVAKSYGAGLSEGSKHDLVGRKLENIIASVLGNHDNLDRFNGNPVATGFRYGLFSDLMSFLGIRPRSLIRIEATTDIPKLPKGGSPKTDVLAKLFRKDGSFFVRTFSVKNTSSSSVSVHEYTADAFADVLDPSNNELRRLLTAFQSAGSAKDMHEDDRIGLTNALRPYLRKLDNWVFSGEGAPGVTREQCACFLITHNKETGDFTFHKISAYIDQLEALNDGTKGFGTIFGWTYASKKRGKSIQLKTRII